jgi:hypothetical protein
MASSESTGRTWPISITRRLKLGLAVPRYVTVVPRMTPSVPSMNGAVTNEERAPPCGIVVAWLECEGSDARD